MAARRLSKRATAEVDQHGLHLTVMMQSGEDSEPALRTLDFSTAETYTLFGLLQSHSEQIEGMYYERCIKRHEESET